MTVSGYGHDLRHQTQNLVDSSRPDVWQEQLRRFRQSSRLQLELIQRRVAECHQSDRTFAG
ncbi:MAG: hypothetical protein HPY30_13795 [Gammaproteobacteria bacterium (ex Lamellibrachia satsuma)]|nr:MAG: hypothetical protein HPY30_13795 [Gammaproteobacteria bacterium (ex Lamellibrachia satsuma)]